VTRQQSKHFTTQSSNQPINKSISQPRTSRHQPNYSANNQAALTHMAPSHPATQLANKTINKPTGQQIHRSTNKATNQPTSQNQ
jgi:hypothetical protein